MEERGEREREGVKKGGERKQNGSKEWRERNRDRRRKEEKHKTGNEKVMNNDE